MEPMLDPMLFNLIFGGPAAAQPLPVPAPVPQIPATPPPALMGDAFGPPAPMPPMQSYEPTNIGPRIAAPNEAYRSEPMPSLGASLEPRSTGGVPVPRPRPSEAPAAADQQSSASDRLLQSLRGVKAPEPPVAQRVATPSLPTLRPIQGGGFVDLLASLGVGPQQALPGLKLPSTLGQALGGR